MLKKLLLVFLLFSSSLFAQTGENFTLVIHGGAGAITRENMTPEQEEAYTKKLTEALKVGYKILNDGGSSLDAIEATIHIMEDSPLFNAGKGAVFTSEGTNELDASIMDGKTLKAGAVAGVTTIKNPISAARKVMENSPHVMLTGAGADLFAKEQGLEIVPNEYFRDEKRYQQFQKFKAKEKEKTQPKEVEKEMKIKTKVKEDGSGQLIPMWEKDNKFGTVGAVALDKQGNLAAGTSTGGMMNKKWGRVGDAPIIGAGTYANNKTCAVSATGHGEYFIRSVVAYDISALMEYGGLSLEEAAGEVVMNKLVDLGGEGGVIAIDKAGNIAMPFNSSGMYRGFIKKDGIPQVKIYKD